MAQKMFWQMVLWSAALGAMVGLFCAGFLEIWHGLDRLIWGQWLSSDFDRIWFSTLVGLIVGLILKLLSDPGSMATIIYHFHKSGALPMRDNLPIQPVSIIGLVAGQSAGPEGALTQAGGSLGAWLARFIKLPALKRVLTLAGMGAGFGAFLGAPVGGALLWLEMLHTRGLEYYEAIVPTLVCSCVAFLTMTVTIGHGIVQPWHVTITTAGASLWWTPLAAAGVGLACGPVAKVYSLLFGALGRLVKRSRLPVVAQTTLAGLIIGLLGYFVPLSYFYGSTQIPHVMQLQGATAMALVVLLLAKMCAASVTIRGHWQGGLIIPHNFMGAVLGKIIAMAVPGMDPTLIMVCSMAAFNSAATQTPLASALIVLALTGCGEPVPVFLASVVGFLAGQGIVLIEYKQSRTEGSIYHLQPAEAQLVP